LHARLAGAASIRHSLRPLISEVEDATPGHFMPRERGGMLETL
jgi:hypothetical protein